MVDLCNCVILDKDNYKEKIIEILNNKNNFIQIIKRGIELIKKGAPLKLGQSF